jgi:hypothetical protein
MGAICERRYYGHFCLVSSTSLPTEHHKYFYLHNDLLADEDADDHGHEPTDYTV